MNSYFWNMKNRKSKIVKLKTLANDNDDDSFLLVMMMVIITTRTIITLT